MVNIILGIFIMHVVFLVLVCSAFRAYARRVHTATERFRDRSHGERWSLQKVPDTELLNMLPALLAVRQASAFSPSRLAVGDASHSSLQLVASRRHLWRALHLAEGASRAHSLVAMDEMSAYLAADFLDPESPEAALPEEFPFNDTIFFQRQDETPDILFYGTPRIVTHIDDDARKAIYDFYTSRMREGDDVLDLCSSWVSHLPDTIKLGRVVGVGMNAEELGRNEQLSTYEVQDLNVNPKLPYDDSSFDFVCNVVSVDYLTKPLEIFKDMYRVLRPGGKAIMSFSNRFFPSKAIRLWTTSSDSQRILLVGMYFKFSADWAEIKAYDITNTDTGDPMFVVEGTK